MNKDTYDYVIVGGGSAGCVLACRLSEDPHVTVLLLEAGGEHDKFLINMPLGYGKTIYSETYSWQFHSEPETETNNRRFYHPRGRVLGGSSAINGMVYVRGQHQDYDDWAAAGATGWDWESVKPYFRKAEDNCGVENDWRAIGGPMRIEGPRDTYPIEKAVIDAGVNAGLPHNPDFNGATQEGIGRYQATMRRGRRWSAANAYLDPARARKNLVVKTAAQVERIEFSGRRATGAVYRQGHASMSVSARREVLLCAGAFHSPQLLQLSGIGPGELLQEHGIDVLYDNRQVGGNLHDHTGVPMSWKLKSAEHSHNRKLAFPRAILEMVRYLFTRRGVMAMPAASVGIFADSSGEGGRPDLQFHCLPVTGDLEASLKREDMAVDPFPGLTMMPYPSRPRSRGRVDITAADPLALPKVTMNWFSEPGDMHVLLRGMHIAQKIADTEPLAALIESRVNPGPEQSTDEAFEEFARKFSHVAYHPVGSCRMGSGETAVVDCDGRVRGVDGLRVVDGSIIPSVPSGNTNAAVIMIAEKIADTIRVG